MKTLLNLLDDIKTSLNSTNHRQILRLQGDLAWCYQQAESIIALLNESYFWCGTSPTTINAVPYKKILGQETSLLIINAHQHFDGNQFAASEGTVRGGGLIILLSPISIPASDHFYHYINEQLSRYDFITIQQDLPLPCIANSNDLTKTVHHLNLAQQSLAIEAIIKTVSGHRRRPLVLTANRGRGKSAALGIAAAQLLNSGVNSIIVCAPSKQASFTLFKHVNLLLQPEQAKPFSYNNDKQSIQFIAADALLSEKTKCDLLIIDEAAALPVPTLESLVRHYSRVVFSSTLHGYEGSGRGFALRFQKKLSEIAPQWRKFHLDTPIRWNDNDPVEHFTLNQLCLTNSPFEIPLYIPEQKIEFKRIDHQQLTSNTELLHEVFSLLVMAHYQTKPSDLEKLLNDPSLSSFVITQKQRVLGVALINTEGNIEEQLCTDIWNGIRRIPGNLIAQSLTFHSAFKLAGTHKFARVQRIAIHPSLHNQGLGKQFMHYLINWAQQQQFDHICASFGATADLLCFWQQLSFQSLRIGLSKDASSGTHSIIVNQSLSQRGQELQQKITQQFQQQLPIQLSRQLQQMDSKVVACLLTERQKQVSDTSNLTSYIDGNLGYEFIEYELVDLMLNSDLSCLTQQQQIITIQKILQNNSWADICKQHNLTGKSQAHRYLKDTIKQLILYKEEINEIR
ncbi:MAG: GNAT family N-acetyltransferase [Psychromonas sp.]